MEIPGIFIAASFDDSARRALCRTEEALRQQYRIRCVRPEKLHVTLLYFGNVPSEALPRLKTLVTRTAAGWERIPFTAKAPDLFGDVLVQHLDSAGRLEKLALYLRAAAAGGGFAFDRKPFRAHVTYCYRFPAPLPDLPQVTGTLDRVQLLQSIRTPEGTVYEPLCTVELQ